MIAPLKRRRLRRECACVGFAVRCQVTLTLHHAWILPPPPHHWVPGFLFSRPNWVPTPSPASKCCFPLGPPPLTCKRVLLPLGSPTPSLATECCPPPLGSYWGDTLACGGGGRENPAVRTTGQKLSCSVYYNPFTLLTVFASMLYQDQKHDIRIDSCKGYDKLTCKVLRWFLSIILFSVSLRLLGHIRKLRRKLATVSA